MKLQLSRCLLIFFAALLLCGCTAADTPTVSPTPNSVTSPTPEITPVPEPTPIAFPTTGYCNGEGVNLRAAPNTESEIMDIFGENAVLEILSLTDGWYEVNLGGTKLFVAEHLITLGEPPRPDNMRWGRIVTETAVTYLAPDEESVTDTNLNQGDTVRVFRRIGEFSHVAFAGKQRYVKTQCIELID